MINLVNLTLFA